MCRVFKSEEAIVRVFGTVNKEKLIQASKEFLKGVENEQRKNEKQNLNSNYRSNGNSISGISFMP